MSGDSVKIIKEKIRTKILLRLRKQAEESRLQKSLLILKKLFACSEFKQAKTILFYASFDGEVETLEMMKQSLTLGKKIALPSIHMKDKTILPTYIHNLEEDLILGSYGIAESRHKGLHPVACDEIDLSVVPGVAFDRDNYRLGRGAGYYDRFLSRLSKAVPAIGLAFDFQIVSRLPRQEHDIPMTSVITG